MKVKCIGPCRWQWDLIVGSRQDFCWFYCFHKGDIKARLQMGMIHWRRQLRGCRRGGSRGKEVLEQAESRALENKWRTRRGAAERTLLPNQDGRARGTGGDVSVGRGGGWLGRLFLWNEADASAGRGSECRSEGQCYGIVISGRGQ